MLLPTRMLLPLGVYGSIPQMLLGTQVTHWSAMGKWMPDLHLFSVLAPEGWPFFQNSASRSLVFQPSECGFCLSPQWEEGPLHLPAWGSDGHRKGAFSVLMVGWHGCVCFVVGAPFCLVWKNLEENRDWVRTVTLCYFFFCLFPFKFVFSIRVCCVSVYLCLHVQVHACMLQLRRIKDSLWKSVLSSHHVGPA